MDKFLCCAGGYLVNTDLLRVGEEGAEWGLDGGKGLRTMTGRFLVGDVDGATIGGEKVNPAPSIGGVKVNPAPLQHELSEAAIPLRGGGWGSRKFSPE